MTDYCAAIAALMAESRKIPSPTTVIDHGERRRNEAMRADLHRQQQDLREQAAKAFAALNGWRTGKSFAMGTLIKGSVHDRYAVEYDSAYDLPGAYDTVLCDHPLYFRG